MDEDGRIVPGHRPAVVLASGLASAGQASYTETVIYCVIPRELEAELFDKMVEYYKDNPNVTVIVDRRDGPDRRAGQEDGALQGAAGDPRPPPRPRRRDVPGHRRTHRSTD